MALRVFTDRSGARWSVWLVVPSGGPDSVLSERYREGWLCFERTTGDARERHRLPAGEVPPAWESMSDERLELLCRVAQLAADTPPSAEASSGQTRRTSLENETKARVSGGVSGHDES